MDKTVNFAKFTQQESLVIVGCDLAQSRPSSLAIKALIFGPSFSSENVTIVIPVKEKHYVTEGVGQKMQAMLDQSAKDKQMILARALLNPDSFDSETRTVQGRCFLPIGCELVTNSSDCPLYIRRKQNPETKAKTGTYTELTSHLFYTTIQPFVEDGKHETLKSLLNLSEAERTEIGLNVDGRNWIHNAIKHPGAFRAQARRHHLLHGAHDTLSAQDMSKMKKIVDKTPSNKDNLRYALAKRLRGFRKSRK